MKKLYAIIVLLFIGLNGFGQKPTPVVGSEAYYLQQSAHEKKKGTKMLAGGLLVAGAGFAIGSSDPLGGAGGFGGLMVIGGVVTALLSISPYSKAGKLKRKAAEVTVGFQEITPLSKLGYTTSNNIPAVQITVNLE